MLVSPHRTRRPWRGQVEKPATDSLATYDPTCYLCPSNVRAGGVRNPAYTNTYVFHNDFSALLEDSSIVESSQFSLLQSQGVRGTCRVVCFSPRHDLSLPEMELKDIREVVEVWCQQMEELARDYLWVQIFENKGGMMGSSNPHPHGQIWASDHLPNEALKEDHHQQVYFRQNRRSLLLDYLDAELADGVRIVVENSDWVALVPFWAIWPYEILLLPRWQISRLPDLEAGEKGSLAAILKSLLIKYDNLFETSFPYSMGWHAAPNSLMGEHHWQLHAHFYPPLLRSATIKKFMVGYEMLAEAQRDLTPEQAAQDLRELPDLHYKQGT